MEVASMRPVILTLLALALLPTVLAGCGSPQPDTVVVTQYRLAPFDPPQVASPEYVLHTWKNTASFLVQELYNDFEDSISYNHTHTTYFRPPPTLAGCNPFWYVISLQQGNHVILSVTFDYCPGIFIVQNYACNQIPPNADFLSVLTQQMQIPIQWR
jgi:hypothetical protein